MGLLKLTAPLFPGVNAWATEKSLSNWGTAFPLNSFQEFNQNVSMLCADGLVLGIRFNRRANNTRTSRSRKQPKSYYTILNRLQHKYFSFSDIR